MAKRFNPNSARLGSQIMALQRMALDYPDEYRRVCEMRKTHEILLRLPVDKFNKLCVEALRGLVREGICKRPNSISYNQR